MDNTVLPQALADQWQAQVQYLQNSVGVPHIDAIIDLSGDTLPCLATLPALSPQAQWSSLFAGLPESALQDQGPVLVRLHNNAWQHQQWLGELMRYYAGRHRLLLLVSPLAFSVVQQQLCSLTQFFWGNESGIFRFYDPRIFPELFNHVLTPGQQDAFNQLGYFWGWLDRDNQQTWRAGKFQPHSDAVFLPHELQFTDKQIDAIGCISDADIAARMYTGTGLTPEALFGRCLEAAFAAARSASGTLEDYLDTTVHNPGKAHAAE
ncbi:DUF4123 domain-containing protein [Mangrovibacter sp. SLW1]